MGDEQSYCSFLSEVAGLADNDFTSNPAYLLCIYEQMQEYQTLLTKVISLQESELFELVQQMNGAGPTQITREIEEFLDKLWKEESKILQEASQEVTDLFEVAKAMHNFRIYFRNYVSSQNEGEFLTLVKRLKYFEAFKPVPDASLGFMCCMTLQVIVSKRLIEKQKFKRGLNSMQEIINDMKADAAMMKQKSHTIITAGHHQGDKMSRLMTLLQTSVLNILSL